MLKNILYTISVLILLASCSSKKNIVYFYDLVDSNTYSMPITNEKQLKIEKYDKLKIRVTTLNEQVNAFMNSGTVGGGGGNDEGNTYVVQENGTINFPMVGEVNLAGLTKYEAKNKLTGELTKYVKDATVNVEFKGFKYMVWGLGLNNGSVFYSENDKVNIIEAIVNAGDVKIGSEMGKVMLIREENGMRNMVRVNLNDSKLLNSPYFYLKQNDMIYVEPKKWMDDQEQRSFNSLRYVTTGLSTFTAIISTYLIIENLTK